MNNQLLRTILAGVLIGGLVFAFPWFTLKVLFFLLIVGAFFRIFRGGWRGRYRGPYGWAFADKIRGMDDAEYEEFKGKWGRGCGHGRYGEQGDDNPPQDVTTQNV